MGIWSRLFGTKKAPKYQKLNNNNSSKVLNPSGPSYTVANNKKLEPTKRRKITNMLKAFGRGLIPASNPNQRTAKQKRLAKEESEKRGRLTKDYNRRLASHEKNLNNAFEKLQLAKNKIGNVGLNVSPNNVEAFEKAYKKYGLLKQNYKSSYNKNYTAKKFNDEFINDFFKASEGRRIARTANSRLEAELRKFARNAGQKQPPRENLTPEQERVIFGWGPKADENSENESEEETEEAAELAAEAVAPTLAASRATGRKRRVNNFFSKYGNKNDFPGQLALANTTEQARQIANDQETMDDTISDFNEYKTKYMAAKTASDKKHYLGLLKIYYKRLLKYEAKSALNNPFSNNPFSKILAITPQELIKKLDPVPNAFTQQLARTS